MWSLLCQASNAEDEDDAKRCREQFVQAISGLEHWTQCMLLDLYDEVLLECSADLPDQYIFYMLCCRSQEGTTEHGLGHLEEELLSQVR
jgi:hypothetical protein